MRSIIKVKFIPVYILLLSCLLIASCKQLKEDATKADQQLQITYSKIKNSDEADSIKAIKLSNLFNSIQISTRTSTKVTDSIFEFLFNQWVANPESFSNIPSFLSQASENKIISEHSRIAASLYFSLTYLTQYKIDQADSLILTIAPRENVMDDGNKILYYRNLGIQYTLKNKSQEATTIFQKAIGLVQNNRIYNPCELGNIYCNFATVYLRMNDNKKALELLKKSYSLLFENNCNSNDLQSTILNIGVAYNNLHYNDSAIWYYKKQLPLITNNSVRNYTMSFIAYLNIGGAFIEEKKYDSARIYLANASLITDKIKDENLGILLNTFSAIADAPTKDVHKEVEQIKEYLALFYKNNDLYNVQNAYEALSKIAGIKHQDKEALFYLEKLDSIKEIVTSAENKKMVGELEAKYHTAQKDLEINKQQTEIKQSRNLSYMLIACLIILILIAILSLQFVNDKKERETAKLREHFTHQLIEGNENERERIARDLHDDINQDLVLLKKETAHLNPEIAIRIDNITNNIRRIARNLYPVSLQLIGLESSIEDLCEQMMNKHELFISTEINYSKSLDKNNELQVFRIIQEAINNIIKHANASAVKVTLTEDRIKKLILLEIKDNGSGFDVDQSLKSKESFGLQSILQRSKVIKGDPYIVSGNKGTVITISIPYISDAVIKYL